MYPAAICWCGSWCWPAPGFSPGAPTLQEGRLHSVEASTQACWLVDACTQTCCFEDSTCTAQQLPSAMDKGTKEEALSLRGTWSSLSWLPGPPRWKRAQPTPPELDGEMHEVSTLSSHAPRSPDSVSSFCCQCTPAVEVPDDITCIHGIRDLGGWQAGGELPNVAEDLIDSALGHRT